LVYWLGAHIWIAETDGPVVVASDKVVAASARLLYEVTTWDEQSARLFAADCAEQVLPLFEAAHPGDDRPRRCIEVARRFARGEASQQELDAAWDAAWAAAGVAAQATAQYAAWAVARAVAWDAAWAAAGAAARHAAALDAVWATARDDTREWQTERLMQYLVGALT